MPFETSLAVQWFGLSALTAGAPGSVPGGETKILQAERHSQKKKKDSFWKLKVAKRFPKSFNNPLYFLRGLQSKLVGDQNLVNLPSGDFLTENASISSYSF